MFEVREGLPQVWCETKLTHANTVLQLYRVLPALEWRCRPEQRKRVEDQERKKEELQKLKATLPCIVLGATKSVPEKLERNLQSATLLVKFTAETFQLTEYLSLFQMLFSPTAISDKLRGIIRDGLVSGLYVPGATI